MKYLVVAFVCLIVIPSVADAQSVLPLVQCSGPDCNWCAFVEMINRLIRWLIMFLSVIAVIVMVIAGFKMVTSGGNTEAWASGKRMFTSVVIGIIIVLAAWLLIDVVLRTLTDKGINDWIPNECGGQIPPSATGSAGTVSGGPGTGGGLTVVNAGDEAAVRAQLQSMGYRVNKSSCSGQAFQNVPGGCTTVGGLSDGMLSSLSNISQSCANCNLVITGGNEAGHQTHDDGNSVDFSFDPGLNAYLSNGGDSSAGLNCVAESDHWHCRR